MRSLFVIMALLAFGCQRGGEGEASQPTPPASGNEFFDLKITPADAKVGAAAESAVEIKPGAGYKINQEFPTKLVLKPVEGISFAKDTLTSGDFAISEKALTFKVTHTASKAGSFEIPAVADFSVCSDQTCKLFRGEALTWKITAE